MPATPMYAVSANDWWWTGSRLCDAETCERKPPVGMGAAAGADMYWLWLLQAPVVSG